MERLLDGIRQFKQEVYPNQRELFEQLAGAQSPQALFITCADSRVVPDLITQSKPGDLFICRNAGNMVPAYNDIRGGVAATIEYAVAALNVADVIVCGHTDCGAMKGILHPELLSEMPAVKSWLANGDLARVVLKENYPELSGAAQLDALIKENVLAQIEHLHTYPCVAARLARGTIRLHAWVYNIKSGEVEAYESQRTEWIPIEEYIPKPNTSRLHSVSA